MQKDSGSAGAEAGSASAIGKESSFALGREQSLRQSVAMNKVERNVRPERLMAGSQNSKRSSSPRFIRLSKLRKWRDCEQVAAVCYRRRGGHLEFLLVRTRGNGRWTFPKGSAERGLTQAQAAALEAFEEAGVHGRIEEVAFSQYILPKRAGESRARGRLIEKEIEVNAYLCEVSRLSPPQESGRNRTWFSPDEARQNLRQDREKSDGAQLARVIHRAVVRIQNLEEEYRVGREIEFSHRLNLSGLEVSSADALRKVKFDFAETNRLFGKSPIALGGSRLTNVRQQSAGLLDSAAFEPSHCEVLEFGASRRKTPKALGSGNL
jgi:8-oxo-dGTP pyrophosphatase MutT (NUDIX family)